MQQYHDHPLLNAAFCLVFLAASKLLDIVHLEVVSVHEWLAVSVQVSQIILMAIAVVNFYWAFKKRFKNNKHESRNN
jgi:hypothetical protein